MVYVENMFHVLPHPVEDAVVEDAVVEEVGATGAALDSRAGKEGITAGGLTPIGWQAREIIASILEDKSPALAEVHWRLRRNLAAHPGSPEHALLAHLRETTELVNHRTG